MQPSSVCAAEVVGGQVEALDVRPERAVEHDDTFGDRIEVGLPIHRRTTLPATPFLHLGKFRVTGAVWGRFVSGSATNLPQITIGRADWRSMSTKTDSLAAGRGPLTRVSRDLSWFDPAPSWRRAADLVVGVARSAPSGAGAIGVPVGEKGAVPRQLGVDRATLTALGFEGKAGQTLVVPRRDGADLVAIGTGTGQLSLAELRDAAAAFARAVPQARGAGDEPARGRRRRRRGGAGRRRGRRARPLPLRVAEVQRRAGRSCSR